MILSRLRRMTSLWSIPSMHWNENNNRVSLRLLPASSVIQYGWYPARTALFRASNESRSACIPFHNGDSSCLFHPHACYGKGPSPLLYHILGMPVRLNCHHSNSLSILSRQQNNHLWRDDYTLLHMIGMSVPPCEELIFIHMHCNGNGPFHLHHFFSLRLNCHHSFNARIQSLS